MGQIELKKENFTKYPLENIEKLKLKDNQVSLIFGINGSGKSSISKKLNEKYGKVKLEGNEEEHWQDKENKALVYNEDFVNKNFSTTTEQKGIFILGEENIEIKNKYEKAKKQKEDLDIKKKEIQEKNKNTKDDIKKCDKDFKNYLWKIFNITERKKNEKTDILLPKVPRQKESLKSRVLDFYNKYANELEEQEFEITEGELKEKLSKLQETKEDISLYGIINFTSSIGAISETLQKPSLLKSIIPIGESKLKELIGNYNNSSWVQEGTQYLNKNEETCPFCQQDMKHEFNFKEELSKLFDASYTQSLTAFKEIYKTYDEQYSKVENFYIELDNNKEYKEFSEIATIKTSYKEINKLLKEKSLELSEKKNSPQLLIEINEEITNSLNNLIEAITKLKNQIITENNDRKKQRDNKNKLEKELNIEIEKYIVTKCQDIVKKYNASKKSLEKAKKESSDEETEISKQITDKERDVNKLSKSCINIEKSIKNINSSLLENGFDNFSMVKHGDNSYQLTRDDEQEEVYTTLSEGEKRLITFLYFIELCKGTDNQEEDATADKIVVIDDPISSLDSRIVFTISCLIVSTFIKKKENLQKCKQLIILTHSIYFWSDITVQINNKELRKLYQLVKGVNNSKLQEMKGNRIKTNYQLLWDILKNYKAEKENNNANIFKISIANTMRQILEYYIAFTNKDRDYKSVLIQQYQKTEKNIKPFFRYLDKGSHQDQPDDLMYLEEISVEGYFQTFKEIFKIIDAENHYKSMIKE